MHSRRSRTALVMPPAWCLAAVVLVPPPLVAAQQQASTQNQQPMVSAQEVGGRLVITGDTVLVVADPDRPSGDASIASKIDAPVRETPRSVSVTERRTLDDRLAVNVANAHDYTVSLTPADERGPAYSRGFFVSFYDLRRDGLRTYAWSVREPVGVERVQYLRGPAAILYGDGSPGGLVNMVLRKPLPMQKAEVTASGGGLGFGRVTGDVTGPIGETRRVRYRLIGAAEWLENGFDNGERRLSLLPTMSFDIGRAATLTIDSELYHQRGRNYRHAVPATADTQHGDFSKLPWDLSVASPDEGWSGWNVSPGVRLDMQVRPATSLHAAVRYTQIDGDLGFEAPLGLAADGRTLNRFNYLERSTWQEWQSDTFVATVAKTGGVEHKLVVGAEAGLSTADSLIGSGAASPIDIYAPVYPPAPAPPPLQPTRYDVLRLGVYAQDQMRLHRSLVIVPGLRWSRLDADDKIARPTVASAEQLSSDLEFSPSLGVVVLPRPWLSVYASATQSFEPPSPGQYLEDGRALSLADVTSFEGGVKVEGVDGRVMASGAVYGIRRTNIPEADARGFYRQIGEGRSRGIEFAGRLAAGLFVQAAYAWTDTEITRSLIGGEGNDLPNAPHHNASIWTRYRFTSGRLTGAMIAAGLVHLSDRFLAANNVTIAPAYTRLDLSGSYELPKQRLRIGVAVPNATNRRYVTSGAGQVLWTGQPRRLVVQLTTWF
jgi:iron complex outermembrane receptor protein